MTTPTDIVLTVDHLATGSVPPDMHSRVQAAFRSVLARLTSDNSRVAYQRHWLAWLAWCSGISLPMLAARPMQVQTHLDELRDQDYAQQSIASRLNVIRQMYASLVLHECLPSNPAREVKAPRTGRPANTPWLEAEAVTRLLQAYGDPSPLFFEGRRLPEGEWRRERNRLILLTFMGLGIRRENMARLAWENLHRTGSMDPNDPEWRIDIVVKGKKPASLAVPRELVQQWNLWKLQCSIPRAAGDRTPTVEIVPPIFPAHPKCRDFMTPDGIYAIVKAAAAPAGIDPAQVTPHALRRSFATLLASMKVPDREIQAAMAHRHMSTTEIYIKMAKGVRTAPGQGLLERLRP